MERDRVKRIYDLHAWTGVIFGLFIYVVSLSGVFALFGEELLTWEDERSRIVLSKRPVPAMSLTTAFVEDITRNATLQGLRLELPTETKPFYSAFARVRQSDSGQRKNIIRHWHPNTGALLPERGDGFVHWIVDFHRNLMLPRTLGRAIVGLAGIVLLLSILSGIVTHRKILREAFTWRLDRSVRLKWQDSHKALGSWGIPFHVMIAFTGAWLGLVALLVPLSAAVSFKGDQGAVLAQVFGLPPEASGTAAPMVSLDDAAREVARLVGVEPRAVVISLWGDKNAKYSFLYRPGRVLVSDADVDVSGATGEIIGAELISKPGFSHRALAAMTSLHYGRFSGLWVKLLYALLGLSLCIVTATGLMMWLERRLHGNEGVYSEAFYRVLSKTTVGVCTGMGLATFAIFYADKLLPVGPEMRMSAIGITYFGVWGAAVLYSWLSRNEYMACKQILALTGLAALGLPILNTVTTGDNLLQLLKDGHSYAAGTDIAGALIGLTLLLVSAWLPSRRPR